MTDLNKHKSAALTDGPNRAAARAMLKACAFTDEDLAKPLVGIANTWTEIGPCNFHLRRLAEHVKTGVRAAGGTPMEFNTVAVSDGITMGAEGMRASLVSREVIGCAARQQDGRDGDAGAREIESVRCGRSFHVSSPSRLKDRGEVSGTVWLENITT